MSYLWIGYALTWLALALYAWGLERRRRDAERELSLQREPSGESPPRDAPTGPR